jgi:hypothetical protein
MICQDSYVNDIFCSNTEWVYSIVLIILPGGGGAGLLVGAMGV